MGGNYKRMKGITSEMKVWVNTHLISSLRHPVLLCGPSYGPQDAYARVYAEMLLHTEDLVHHPDYVAVGHLPEHRARIDVDSVRDLVAQAALTPVSGAYRVLVIFHAERLTQSAGNVLLKSLEEHRDHVVWILTTSAPERIMDTVRSRCEEYAVPVWVRPEGAVTAFFELEESASVPEIQQACAASSVFWRAWMKGEATRVQLQEAILAWSEIPDEPYVPWEVHLDIGIDQIHRSLSEEKTDMQHTADMLDFLRHLRHTIQHNANTTLIFESVICNMDPR